MKIALLGLGRMGRAVAARLMMDGGHELVVWNRSPGKAEDVVRAGGVEAPRPEAAVDAAEVVVTSLTDDVAVRSLLLDREELRETLRSRAVVDMSTISPELSGELGRTLPRFLALPVLGAPAAVRAGEATYLAGGAATLVDELGPLLVSLGGRCRRYPAPEMAASAKLAVNLLLLSAVAALAEAFTVGRAGGLGDDDLTELLGDAPVVPPAVRNRFGTILSGSGPTWWTTVLGSKDARLATESAAAAGRQLRLGATLRDLYQAAADAGYAEEDIAAVARLYR